MTGERDRLRSTFDGAAPLYDEVRPGYPEALFDDVASLSVIPSRGRILEIGCGTGQATVPLARRGYGVLCIEFGETLAVVARRNLAGYPGVEVRVRAFEAYPVAEEAFDLAVSATAFHWLDPAVALPKVARSLKPGGAIALFWNEHVRSERNEGFFEAAQRIYAREAPEIFDDNYGDRPDPTKCRTGPKRSRTPTSSARPSGGGTVGIKPTTPQNTSGSSTPTPVTETSTTKRAVDSSAASGA